VRRQSDERRRGDVAAALGANERRRGHATMSRRAQQDAGDDGVEHSYLVPITTIIEHKQN
jgi:hypothetical protein